MTEGPGFYRNIVESSTSAIVVVGADAVVLHHTRFASRMLAGPSADLVGRLFPSLFSPEAQDVVDSFLRQVAQADPDSSTFIEVTCVLGDGDERSVEMTAVNLLESPEVCGIVLNLVDRTELRRALVLAESRARLDSLTGLANSWAIEETYKTLVRENPDRPLVVAYFDLDRFKGVNDRWGHSVGDVVLRSVAHRLSASLGGFGTVARRGGDEFIVILPDVDLARASELLATANRAVCLPVEGMEHFHITASCGAVSSGAASGWTELVRLADSTLYEAKRRNRGGICFYREGQLGWEERRKGEQDDALLHAQKELIALKSDLVRLEQETRYNERTGLLNDTAFAQDHAALHLLAAQRGETYALILCDIDFFGLYNKRYLYEPANATLRKVADALKAGCRPDDHVYRYGGEELVLLLPHTSLQVARERAEQLRAAVEELGIAHDARPEPHIVTISVGVAECDPHGEGAAPWVLDAANKALVRAKEGGRNRVEMWSDDD